MKHISTSDIKNHISKTEYSFLSDEFALVLDSGRLEKSLFRPDEPYMQKGGRLTRILAGHATYHVNMEPVLLQPGDTCFFADGSVMEAIYFSDDFRAQVLSVLDIPAEQSFPETTLLHLDTLADERVGSYFALMWETVSASDFSMDTIRQLQTALLSDLRHNWLAGRMEVAFPQSRKAELFKRFLGLVNAHADTQHRIGFYADNLYISPNRLSAIIKEQSGETVMYWINRAIILHARILLRHTDLLTYEIADRLNFPNASFFSNFFKKQTGMTPQEYRKANEKRPCMEAEALD